jgi:hypothetical protein
MNGLQKKDTELRRLIETLRAYALFSENSDCEQPCLVEYSSANYEFEIAVENNSTAVRISDRSTGEQLFAAGWPYLLEQEDAGSLGDVVSELRAFVNYLRRRPQVETLH